MGQLSECAGGGGDGFSGIILWLVGVCMCRLEGRQGRGCGMTLDAGLGKKRGGEAAGGAYIECDWVQAGSERHNWKICAARVSRNNEADIDSSWKKKKMARHPVPCAGLHKL